MNIGKRRIYLDHASATPLRKEAQIAMRDAEKFVGNPGAIHAEGVAAKAALTSARESIADAFGVKAREIIFTSGLTEGNNIAILGLARRLEFVRRSLQGTHWIVSAIEHDSVLSCFSEIERLGGEVTHVRPNEKGIVTAEGIAASLKPETVCVSVGWANNEIGIIQPLAKIAKVLHAHEEAHGTRVVLHTDAGQAPLYLPAVFHSLGADLVSLGAEKLYGPHGVGALYVSNRAELSSPIFGGAQERGLRAGTENVALAAGFAAALEADRKEREAEAKRLEALRNELARELAARIPGLAINGDLSHSLPHMLNISIPNIQSEYITLALDRAGIAVSTKSACREGEERRSHVVAALSDELWRAENTLRFSLGRDTKKSDIKAVIDILPKLVSISA